jgi:glycosyltransferase involved in cell wall biosynthesis
MIDPASRADVAVALFMRRRPDVFLPTIRSIRRAVPDAPVLVGAPDVGLLDGLGDLEVDTMVAYAAAELANHCFDRYGTHVLALDDAVILPEAMLDRAVPKLDDDLRVCTVSFLCNAAGPLSFPHLMTPSSHQLGRFDESSLTLHLREAAPEPAFAPLSIATGAAVCFSATALRSLGPLTGEKPHRLEWHAAEFSLRGLTRGFQSLLDAGTFYSRPFDLALLDQETYLEAPEISALLVDYPFAGGCLDQRLVEHDSPLDVATRVSRVKTTGLRVLVDASCVGPMETGTQVQTLALVEELADRDDVSSIAVGLPGSIPPYAERVLSHGKVDARPCPPNDFSVFGDVDVAHRPFQPDLAFDPVRWRRNATRAVITMQDLIAYQVAPYHRTDDEWRRVRAGVRRSIAMADGVVVISHDTHEQLRLENLPVDDERVFVVENGTDHISGHEEERTPSELVRRGLVANEFVLVLGTNYGHKNRDLAIRAVTDLRWRGRSLSLVMVGAQVPWGSLRQLESRAEMQMERAFASTEGLVIIPDVASEERNWLLRHARLVLYPTSAEGFGLVPFEAARYGTASVSVSFGPLREVSGSLPVTAESWDPSALADACERLLDDPDLYDRQITALLAAGDSYRWSRTAESLTDVYRSVLAKPPRML